MEKVCVCVTRLTWGRCRESGAVGHVSRAPSPAMMTFCHAPAVAMLLLALPVSALVRPVARARTALPRMAESALPGADGITVPVTAELAPVAAEQVAAGPAASAAAPAPQPPPATAYASQQEALTEQLQAEFEAYEKAVKAQPAIDIAEGRKAAELAAVASASASP
eukprot:7252411-Prymnesium_polylepis.1